MVSDCQLIGNAKAVPTDVSDAVAPPRCGAFANSPVEVIASLLSCCVLCR